MSEQNNEQKNDFNSLLEVIQYLSDGGFVEVEGTTAKMVDGKITPVFPDTHKPMMFNKSVMLTDCKLYKKVEPLPKPLKWYEKEGALPCLCLVSDSIDFDTLDDDKLSTLLKNKTLEVMTVKNYDKKLIYKFLGDSDCYPYAKPIKIEFLEI